MKKLDYNWLTEGLVDFEYKRYLLLSYFQEVERSFGQIILYPFLSDLVFHYQNLLQIKQNKQLLYENFPKEISKADFNKLTLIYNRLITDDKVMGEIEEIISYSIPEFKRYLEEGKDIYQYIEANLSLSPIGLTPLQNHEGYVFLSKFHDKEADIFEYQVSIFQSADETYRGIHLKYLESIRRNLGTSFEMAKVDLIRRYKKIPNPATFLIESKVQCPVDETLLPIAKRLLMKHLATKAA